MDMLAWSAWLRVHAVDPEWYPQVIMKQGYGRMNWENWSSWQRGDNRWQVTIIDTSGKKIDQIVGAVAKWVGAQVSANPALPLDPKDEMICSRKHEGYARLPHRRLEWPFRVGN